jgi:hypothetical protein
VSDGGNLPSLAALRVGHSKLTERRDAPKNDHTALRKQAPEYGIIKRNVDSMLNVSKEQTKARYIGKKLVCNSVV